MKKSGKSIKQLKNFLNLTNSQKRIILYAALFVTAVCSYYGFIDKNMKELSVLNLQLREKRAMFDDIKAYMSGSTGSALYKERHSLRSSLFEADGILNFHNEMSNIISSSGNQLVSLTPVLNEIPPERTPEIISKMPEFELQKFSYRVSAEGDFWSIMSLIKDIEKYEKILNVGDFDIQCGDAGYPKLKASFTITMYLL